jgi:uncharacterized membrane protein
MKIESELRFGPSSFVARRKLGKVGNSFRILGFESGFASLSLQPMKMIPFVLLPHYFERESWLGVSSLLYFVGKLCYGWIGV